MDKFLDVNIKQIFTNDPLLWLWLLLGVVFFIGLGILLSWIFGKPVLKFYIDGDVRSVVPKKRGERIEVPIDLTEYAWFIDKSLTNALDEGEFVKKRVTCLYTDSAHIIQMENKGKK